MDKIVFYSEGLEPEFVQQALPGIELVTVYSRRRLIESLVDEKTAVNDSPVETMLEATYRLVAISFSNPKIAWRVMRSILALPNASGSPMFRMGRILEDLVEKAKAGNEFDNRIDSAGCARAILGTFFAELYSLTSSTQPGVTITREDFDSVAAQLTMEWTKTDA